MRVFVFPPPAALPGVHASGLSTGVEEDAARPRAVGRGDEAARLPPAPRATYEAGQQAAALTDAASELVRAPRVAAATAASPSWLPISDGLHRQPRLRCQQLHASSHKGRRGTA
jgi:hypothetical protein